MQVPILQAKDSVHNVEVRCNAGILFYRSRVESNATSIPNCGHSNWTRYHSQRQFIRRLQMSLGMKEPQANRRWLTFFNMFLGEASLFEFSLMVIHPNYHLGIRLILQGDIAVSMFMFVFYEFAEASAPFWFYPPDKSNGIELINAILSYTWVFYSLGHVLSVCIPLTIHPFSQSRISLVLKRDVVMPELTCVLNEFFETHLPRFMHNPDKSDFIQIGDAILGQVLSLYSRRCCSLK